VVRIVVEVFENKSGTTPAYSCIWNVHFASHNKHSLPYSMAACTWWP